jgi:hypothetical protein
MRKPKKIKALLLLLSWLIIFMHGVVPHLHANHTDYDLHGEDQHHQSDCGHNHSESENYAEGIILCDSHDHDSSLCHFNPNLFSQLDIDCSFLFVSLLESRVCEIPVYIVNPDAQKEFKKPPLITNNSLRAPPTI